jgi:hypothetical protein
LGVNEADLSFRLPAGFLSQSPDAVSRSGGESDCDTTKLLGGQILIVFATVVAGVSSQANGVLRISRQSSASLGSCCRVVRSIVPGNSSPGRSGTTPTCRPSSTRQIAAFSSIVGCAVAIIGSLWRARQNRLVTTSRPRLFSLGDRPGDRGGRAVPQRRRLPRPAWWKVSAP